MGLDNWRRCSLHCHSQIWLFWASEMLALFKSFLTSSTSQTTKPCCCIITLRHALPQWYMSVGHSSLYVIMNFWYYFILCLYWCVVLVSCTYSFGEHVCRTSLLCNPGLLTKIEYNTWSHLAWCRLPPDKALKGAFQMICFAAHFINVTWYISIVAALNTPKPSNCIYVLNPSLF